MGLGRWQTLLSISFAPIGAAARPNFKQQLFKLTQTIEIVFSTQLNFDIIQWLSFGRCVYSQPCFNPVTNFMHLLQHCNLGLSICSQDNFLVKSTFDSRVVHYDRSMFKKLTVNHGKFCPLDTIWTCSLYITFSVTRLGDILDFGRLFKAFGDN